MVEATLNYLAPMEERPFYVLHETPPGAPRRNTKGDRRVVEVHDARALDPPACLDREGFALVRHRTAVDLYDADAVRDAYYREVERLVAGATGATRVLAFDHNLRRADGGGGAGVQDAVRLVHNDYTERSGPQRVRDLLGASAEPALAGRFAVVNAWRPIVGPVATTPLAVCDARSIPSRSLVPSDLRYPDRTGEIYTLTFDPGHRWFSFPGMRTDEVLLIKCFDSGRGRARFTAHTAFDDPTSPAGAPSRESIEVRTLAFFATHA